MTDPILLSEENIDAFVKEGLDFMKITPKPASKQQSILITGAHFGMLAASIISGEHRDTEVITLSNTEVINYIHPIYGEIQVEPRRGIDIEITKLPVVDMPDIVPYRKPKKKNAGLRLGSYKFKGK